MLKKFLKKYIWTKSNHKQRDDVNVGAKDLLDFNPTSPITESGLRQNISIGIQYIGAWLAGTGCVPIFNLMEDAATLKFLVHKFGIGLGASWSS